MPYHVLLARAVAPAPAALAALADAPASGGGGSSAPGTLLWVAIAGLASSLIAGGLVAWSVKQLITPSLNRAGASVADLLADYLAVLRSRSLRRIRRYQRSVGDYARRHTLGFGSEPISVRDVYVPLARETAGRREDLYEAVREEPRSVVTGEAGAGKSMLLKHSLLEWSERRTDRRSEIPVLVELRRLNAVPADEVDLTGQIQAFLETHRFKGGAGFVPKALEDGRLSLLFDGLDEVTADRLDGVVQKLKDFAERYSDCQIVVTCRSSLYNGDLEFPTVVRVAELDDATIRRLLYRWPGLDPASQERLYRTLGSNATLKRLARSPLLLSMMAWMTTSGIVLPTSRAEFYDTAIAHLVQRDDVLKRGRSQFTANKKLAVLRGMALILQDRSGTDQDRLNISHTRALEQVRSIAASIDLDEKDAEPLLKEIVDRSELLTAGGGVAPSYSFRHLTFQEYLAAVELRDDRDGLLERYVKDPNAWRETVKLWCGKADRDATPLIRHLLDSTTLDARMMALECVSVTTKVDEAIVVEAADALQEHLVDTAHQAVRAEAVTAFGNAGAGSGPRSALIRERLFRLAKQDATPLKREAAMLALAASGHDSAAYFLAAESARGHPTAREALLTMGDLAVPSLRVLALAGEVAAVDDLTEIGTPLAVEALVETLAQPLDGIAGEAAVRAAWRLAERLDDAVTTEAIAGCAPEIVPVTESTWVWERFSGGSTTLTAVVGRIYDLVTTSEPDVIPGTLGGLDFRLVLASVVVRKRSTTPAMGGEIVRQAAEVLNIPSGGFSAFAGLNWIDSALGKMLDQPAVEPSGQVLYDRLLDHYQLEHARHRMLLSLPWRDQLRVLRLLASNHTRSDWQSMPMTKQKQPRTWPLVIGASLLAGVYCLGVGFWQECAIVNGHWTWGARWLAALGGGTLFLAVIILVGSIVNGDTEDTLSTAGATVVGVALLLVPYHVLVAIAATASWIGWRPTWILVAVVGGGTALIAAHAWHRHRRFHNPLRQAIEAAGATSSSTSIIAGTAQP